MENDRVDSKNPKKDSDKKSKSFQIDRILLAAREMNASDVHFKVGYKPIVRVNGMPKCLETDVVSEDDMPRIVNSVLIEEKKQIYLQEHKNVDASLEIRSKDKKYYRHRINVAQDRRGPFVAIRLIPDKIMDVSEVGFPEEIWKNIVGYSEEEISGLKRGLVLVTGITGSGKTTTLASLINEINKRRHEHIITLEDPVEYVYKPLKSIISQRELGSDVYSFADGVKYSLREDPDVILVGEIRDRETALHALEATETGHIVFSTLHTKNAAETVSRYVNLFEAEDHDNIRDSLAANLSYILSQQLIPRTKIGGRKLAMEVMNVKDSSGIKKLLRKGEYHKIMGQIQIEHAKGSILMDEHIKQLYNSGDIEKEDAINHAHNSEGLRNYIIKEKNKKK